MQKFRNYMKSWVEFFQKFNSRGVGIRMPWLENFGKINKRGVEANLLGTKEYFRMLTGSLVQGLLIYS